MGMFDGIHQFLEEQRLAEQTPEQAPTPAPEPAPSYSGIFGGIHKFLDEQKLAEQAPEKPASDYAEKMGFPVEAQPPAPTTVEQMYQTVLGREGEKGGVDYWKSVFGDTVDPNELATFKGAAQAELDKRSPLEQASLTPSVKDKADDWFAQHPNATPQEVTDTIKSNGGMTPELAKVLAEHYGIDANQIQNNYNQLTAPKSFQDQIYQYSPETYNKIKNLAQYTANENFGGQVQDYQIQLFTPLDTKNTGIPKQLEFTQPAPITSYDENGNPYTYTPQPQVKNANVTQDEDGNFVSIKPTYVNGVPVTASYDANGKITNYQGDPRVVTWLNGQSYAYGNWDAQGNAQPKTVGTHSGGFFSGIAGDIAGLTKSLGPLWTAAKIYNPALNFVDVATDVGQGNFGGKTALSAASGAGEPVAKGGAIGALNLMTAEIKKSVPRKVDVRTLKRMTK